MEVVKFLNYSVRITDGPNFYIQYKDEFVRQIYGFHSEDGAPLIIDGGSNIGMSVLYFKHLYPDARIIAFEPDPRIFAILQENVSRNHLGNVTLVNAGLGGKPGDVTFVPDGMSGGHIGEAAHGVRVRIECLSSYITQPVDFMKLNIEGQELEVLRELEMNQLIRNVKELVLEYHGWSGAEQRLGNILNLLDCNGYRYLVHDFDSETCSATKPPFRLKQSPWFCLVYARRR